MQHRELDSFIQAQPTRWARLAAAVVVAALKDAARGDPEAVRWMQGEGSAYLEGLGLDAGALLSRLETQGA